MEQIIQIIKDRNKILDGRIRSKTGQILYKVTCRRCHQRAKIKQCVEGFEQQNQNGKITRLHLPKYCKR